MFRNYLAVALRALARNRLNAYDHFFPSHGD
jgi:hypothetical protein